MGTMTMLTTLDIEDQIVDFDDTDEAIWTTITDALIDAYGVDAETAFTMAFVAGVRLREQRHLGAAKN